MNDGAMVRWCDEHYLPWLLVVVSTEMITTCVVLLSVYKNTVPVYNLLTQPNNSQKPSTTRTY